VDVTLEVAAEGDVEMADVENATRMEEEEDCPEVPRESGIARAVIPSERRPQPVKDWLEKEICGKTFKLGKTLDSETQDHIAKVICRHLDAFAWSASDMPGIYLDFLSHRLAMDPQVKPVL